MSPVRSILLVGEGNFSFSASVSRSESDTSITATCPQPREEALRHEGAAGNIETITDSGGTVLFEVDCTRLGECASLRGCVFDRVVFNFPHCGRKSGVKKNRELLKHFFLSCAQVLSEDGEVHVSLCNGQGGTPADQPRREWHNSWQVVAMAAEAHLILSDVRPFERENYESYRCTGYRSQDKGFHAETGLLHLFTRSPPYTSAQTLEVEEAVEGDRVLYAMPAELSDYIFRGFLCSGSAHPVRLVQEYLLKGLSEKWSVSMTTETIPFLLAAKRLQAGGGDVDAADCYRIRPRRKGVDSSLGAESLGAERLGAERLGAESLGAESLGDESLGAESLGAESLGAESLGDESLRLSWLHIDPEGDRGLYVLRPSLLPQMEELLTKREESVNAAGGRGANEGNNASVGVEGHEEEEEEEEEGEGACGDGAAGSLFGVSGLVFRNALVAPWNPPAFHELLLTGVFPSAGEPAKSLGRRLEALLAPHGVSFAAGRGGLSMAAPSQGSVGKVFASAVRDAGAVRVTASLNLDLLAALLFSLPDWRPLWSRDPRLSRQFERRPPPGTALRPPSLFPERLSFDVSFWTGPAWEERRFHAVVREAGRGTVERVELVDTFPQPDGSRSSRCYRLSYRSHTHALSHTRALRFHRDIETSLGARLHVTIR